MVCATVAERERPGVLVCCELVNKQLAAARCRAISCSAACRWRRERSAKRQTGALFGRRELGQTKRELATKLASAQFEI